MIKYLREKITGRPAAFSPASDLPFDDNLAPLNETHSQNSLIDVMSMSNNSNSNETMTGSNQVASQLERFGTMASETDASSSHPIIIPKKPSYSNISPPSSSSYTSTLDQMSSVPETSFLSRIESDEGNTSLPTLASSCQRLEHAAARDRIAVKNQRRQPTREKLKALQEIDDRSTEPFSPLPEEDEESVVAVPHFEPRAVQLPGLDLSKLGPVRAALRASVRPRDRSADTVLQTSNAETLTPPTTTSSMQRSVSFKRSQELNQSKFINRLPFKVNRQDLREDTPSDDEPFQSRTHEQREEKSSSPSTSNSHTSSQEHIYDNLDLFKRHPTTDIVSVDDDSVAKRPVKAADQGLSVPSRLRPISMHVSANDTEKSSVKELENVFNQLKKRAPVRQVRPDLETPVTEEPIASESVATKKPFETPSIAQPFNRRKTVGGIHLSANNKVATDEPKPTPSWIDIAKQKQNKFQSISDETNEVVEQPSPSMRSVKPAVATVPSPVVARDSTGADNRLNRKSMFEPATTHRVSPAPSSPVLERDSIRALKNGNPNRINNLIQFFDK